jgi:hypothetical protein
MARLPSFPDPVNETSARVVAGGVVAMAGVSVAFRKPWLMVPLVYGFAARAANGPRFSPLGLLATKVVTPRLPVTEKLTPGPPKRLAQAMGLTMSLSALILHYSLGRRTAARRVLMVLLGAASLEAFAGICLACKLFPLLMRLGLVSDEACESCKDIWSSSAGRRRAKQPEAATTDNSQSA